MGIWGQIGQLRYLFWSVVASCTSSGSQVFFKEAVLKNFAKFTRKHFCRKRKLV